MPILSSLVALDIVMMTICSGTSRVWLDAVHQNTHGFLKERKNIDHIFNNDYSSASLMVHPSWFEEFILETSSDDKVGIHENFQVSVIIQFYLDIMAEVILSLMQYAIPCSICKTA